MNHWYEWVGVISLGLIFAIAVGAWGMVQVLDIMEALDLRRIERQKELQKAREYLRNPTKDDNVAKPYTNGYTQTAGQYTSGTSGNVNSTKFNNSWTNTRFGG